MSSVEIFWVFSKSFMLPVFILSAKHPVGEDSGLSSLMVLLVAILKLYFSKSLISHSMLYLKCALCS